MHADEHRIAIGIRYRRPVFVGRIRIVIPGHHHAKSLPLEFQADLPRLSQYDVFLHDSVRPLRAVVGPPVRRIDHNRRAYVRWRGWDRRRGCWILLRGGGLRWRSLIWGSARSAWCRRGGSWIELRPRIRPR